MSADISAVYQQIAQAAANAIALLAEPDSPDNWRAVETLDTRRANLWAELAVIARGNNEAAWAVEAAEHAAHMYRDRARESRRFAHDLSTRVER